MKKELIVYGASDDLVIVEGLINTEYSCYDEWYGLIKNGDEEIRLYLSYGQNGKDWTIKIENPYGWVVSVGERPDRASDPAFYIIPPKGDVTIIELDEEWDDASYDLVAYSK